MCLLSKTHHQSILIWGSRTVPLSTQFYPSFIPPCWTTHHPRHWHTLGPRAICVPLWVAPGRWAAHRPCRTSGPPTAGARMDGPKAPMQPRTTVTKCPELAHVRLLCPCGTCEPAAAVLPQTRGPASLPPARLWRVAYASARAAFVKSEGVQVKWICRAVRGMHATGRIFVSCTVLHVTDRRSWGFVSPPCRVDPVAQPTIHQHT